MRLRLDLAYDGTDFHGWAAQPSLRTVQETVESALDTVLRTTSTSVTCAGRTDAGVHARGQVLHVDVDEELLVAAAVRTGSSPPEALLRRLNGVLPGDVRVLRSAEAGPGFDARFSALWRRYVYRIADAPHLVDPLRRREVLTLPRPLDIAAMSAAADRLIGEHDFAAFCKRRVGATTVRTLLELSWQRDAGGLVTATVKADAFCHNMVRALVGALLEVGEGRRDAAWPGQVLSRGQKHPAVRVMPARGLTLEAVAYPPDADLAAQASVARVMRTLTPGPECCG